MNKEIEEIRHWKAVSERRYEIIKEQQQKIEQLENQLYISDKAHQRVCAENVELEKIIKEAINLPKGVEPHSYSDYLKVKTNQINKQ